MAEQLAWPFSGELAIFFKRLFGQHFGRRQAMRLCELVGGRAHEHVMALIEQLARDFKRMAMALERTDRADVQCAAIHYGGVQLQLTASVGQSAIAHCVHAFVVFDH